MADYFEEIGLWPKGSQNIASFYAVGFVLSLALTLLSYFLASGSGLPRQEIALLVAIFAFVQFLVQVVCFLHLGKESSSRERLGIFLVAIFVVVILVSGSLWIMYNLSVRMMPTPAQMEQYMNSQIGF